MVHKDLGELPGALAIWQAIAERAPYPPALFHSALALLDLGRPPEAVPALEQLLKVVPPDSPLGQDGRKLLNGLYAQLGRRSSQPGDEGAPGQILIDNGYGQKKTH